MAIELIDKFVATFVCGADEAPQVFSPNQHKVRRQALREQEEEVAGDSVELSLPLSYTSLDF